MEAHLAELSWLGRIRHRQFTRSFELVNELDEIRLGLRDGAGQGRRPWLAWVGFIVLGIGAVGIVASPLLSNSNAYPAGGVHAALLGVAILLFISGLVLALLNLSHAGFVRLLKYFEFSSPVGRGALRILCIAFSVFSGGFAAFLLWAPLPESGYMRFILEGGAEPVVQMWQIVLMLLGICLFFVVWFVGLVSTTPIVSLERWYFHPRKVGLAKTHIVAACAVACGMLAFMRVAAVKLGFEMTSASILTLMLAMVSVIFALAGKHQTEMKRRRALTLELIEGLYKRITVTTPPGDMREYVSRLVRESRFPPGGWWWYPDPELFDDILLDLFRSLAPRPEGVSESLGVQRLRNNANIRSILIGPLLLDLQDLLLALHPRNKPEAVAKG